MFLLSLLTTNYTVWELSLTFLLSFLLAYPSLHFPSAFLKQRTRTSVYMFSHPSINSSVSRNGIIFIFITLTTLSSMLCAYYSSNTYLITYSMIRYPFLTWVIVLKADSDARDSFPTSLFLHLDFWPLPAARPWWCHLLCPFQGLHHNTRLPYQQWSPT